MNEDFMQLAPSLDRSITQRSILKDDNPAQLASRIRATKCNAIIIYAQEDAMISEAIESAAAAGIPVVIIISDLPTSSRLAYAGIDHYSAGRTAGYFMARMARRSGPVLVLCYHLGVQGHAKRVSGITDAMKADDSGWLWLNCGRGMTILKFRNGFWWTL
jgi:LacI family transcriptional regulator, galactose operon repressor